MRRWQRDRMGVQRLTEVVDARLDAARLHATCAAGARQTSPDLEETADRTVPLTVCPLLMLTYLQPFPGKIISARGRA